MRRTHKTKKVQLALESLEDRLAPVIYTGASMTIPIPNAQPSTGARTGDQVSVDVTLKSTDPGENNEPGETEYFVLSTSNGPYTFQGLYNTPYPTFTITAHANGETMSGAWTGYDQDESVDVTTTITTGQPKQYTPAEKAAFQSYVDRAGAYAILLAVGAGASAAAAPISGTLTIGAALEGGIAWYYATKLAHDPPDPNYTSIAQPNPPQFAPVVAGNGITQQEADAFNALFSNQEQQLGLLNASSTSLNRSSGAFDAGDSYWFNQQKLAAAGYNQQFAALMNAEPALLTNLQTALTNAGFSLTLASTDVTNFEQQVATNGLPQLLLSDLQQAGLSSTDITGVTNMLIVQDPTAVAGTLPAELTDPNLISATQGAASALTQSAQNFVPAHWRAAGIGVGPDSTAHVIWDSPTNALDVWGVTPAFGVSASTAYGPYSGWAAISTATGNDGVTRILWEHTSGAADLWLVAANGQITNSPTLGPFTGWTPRALAVGSDNLTRILWTNTSGQMVIWTVTNSFQVTSSPVYGPFNGWSVRAMSAGSDGLLRVLWDNTDGATALWLMNSNGTLASSAVFGPNADWTAQAITVGSDDKTRLLWTNTDGSTVVWTVDNSFNVTSGPVYGPIAGWVATSLAAQPDGSIDLLWNNENGEVAVWVTSSNGSLTSAAAFGPF
jgi:hypothetical protein